MNCRLLVLVAVFVVLSFVSGVDAVSIWGCNVEYCLQNITSNRWECHYQDCSSMPNLTLVNVTNVTIDNRTVIEFANYTLNLTNYNCDNVSFINAFNNRTSTFIDAINETFNISGQYADCRISKDSLNDEITSCSNKVDDFVQNYINKNDAQRQVDDVNARYSVCTGNVSTLSAKIVDEQNFTSWKMVGAFIAGLLVFYLYRQQKASRTTMVPQSGDFSMNAKEADRETARIQKMIDGSAEIKKEILRDSSPASKSRKMSDVRDKLRKKLRKHQGDV